MINWSDVRENLDEWLKNPSWKEVYDGAPSTACRKYIAMMFYASETEEEEAFADMDKLEEGLMTSDLRYLQSVLDGPAKKKFAELIQKREAEK